MNLTKNDVEKEFKALFLNKNNKSCFDCLTKGPTWTSLSFGTFICQECAGIHRNLGVHISFVKSIILDSWAQHHVNIMKAGGNAKAREALGETTLNTKDFKTKYTTKSALSYREKLQKETENSEQLIDFSHETDQPKKQNLDIFSPTQKSTWDDLDIFKPITHNEKPPLKHAVVNNTITSGNTAIDDLDIFKPIPKNSEKNTTIDNLDIFNTNTKNIEKDQRDDLDIFNPVLRDIEKNTAIDDLAIFNSNIKNTEKDQRDNLDIFNPRGEKDSLDDLFRPAKTGSEHLDIFRPHVTTANKQNTDDLYFFKDNKPLDMSGLEDLSIFESTVEKKPKETQKKRTFKTKPRGNGSKLGARKVQSTVFQQHEEQARREEKVKEDVDDEKPVVNTYSPLASKPTETYENKERLGMMSTRGPEKTEKEDTETFARDRFGDAKAISSDQYFGRKAPARADMGRLTQSDQYFGTSTKTFSKKVLNVASKGANKLQSMLAEMEGKK